MTDETVKKMLEKACSGATKHSAKLRQKRLDGHSRKARAAVARALSRLESSDLDQLRLTLTRFIRLAPRVARYGNTESDETLAEETEQVATSILGQAREGAEHLTRQIERVLGCFEAVEDMLTLIEEEEPMTKVKLVLGPGDPDWEGNIKAPGPGVADRLRWLRGELARVMRRHYPGEDCFILPCPIDDAADDEPHSLEISLRGESVILACDRRHDDDQILEAIIDELRREKP